MEEGTAKGSCRRRELLEYRNSDSGSSLVGGRGGRVRRKGKNGEVSDQSGRPMDGCVLSLLIFLFSLILRATTRHARWRAMTLYKHKPVPQEHC